VCRRSGRDRAAQYRRIPGPGAELGERLHDRLGALVGLGITAVRGKGLWAGVDIDPALMSGREASERLMALGVLAKDTHGSTIRLAPAAVHHWRRGGLGGRPARSGGYQGRRGLSGRHIRRRRWPVLTTI